MRNHIFYNTVNFQPVTFRILFFRGIQTLQMRLSRKGPSAGQPTRQVPFVFVFAIRGEMQGTDSVDPSLERYSDPQ